MAVYKIFPEKSATLYSYYPILNAGLDEILEASTYYSLQGTNEVSRPIIKFPSNQISDIITNKININIKYSLKMFFIRTIPVMFCIII